MRTVTRLGFVCAVMSWCLFLQAVNAATITVTSSADDGGPDTLRTAIANASPGDTINFNADMTITLTSDTLTLDHNLTIDGGSNTVAIDGNDTVGIFTVNPGVTAQLSNLTIQLGNNNAGAGNGGGVSNSGTLTLTNCTVFGNIALNNGGGIFNASGALTLTNTKVSENGTNDCYGSGIYNVSGTVTLTNSTVSENHGFLCIVGGGIFNGNMLTLTNSTVSGNGGPGALGGGIYNEGTVNLTNSTISGNDGTVNGPSGSGIYSSGTVNLTNSTISGNRGLSPVYASSGSINFINTIITDGCSVSAGSITEGGGNIDTGTSCGFGSGSQSNVTALSLDLGPLQDNGGPTQTMMPRWGSVAINAIGCTLAPPTDQRGYVRPDPPNATLPTPCDVGAVEYYDAIFVNGFES